MDLTSCSSDKENDTEMQLLSKFIAASFATFTTHTYNSTLNTIFRNLIRSPHDQVARVNSSYKLSEAMETPFPVKIIVYPLEVSGVGAAC